MQNNFHNWTNPLRNTKKTSFQTISNGFSEQVRTHILYHCLCNFVQIPFVLKFWNTLFGFLRFRTKVSVRFYAQTASETGKSRLTTCWSWRSGLPAHLRTRLKGAPSSFHATRDVMLSASHVGVNTSSILSWRKRVNHTARKTSGLLVIITEKVHEDQLYLVWEIQNFIRGLTTKINTIVLQR